MRIRYNVAKIMAKAHQLTREQLVRDQQFISIGRTPPHTQLRDFNYNLKTAWRMARCGKYDFLNGWTYCAFFDYIIVED